MCCHGSVPPEGGTTNQFVVPPSGGTSRTLESSTNNTETRAASTHFPFNIGMANILLMPVGSHGDVHPFVALGKTLQGRGHDVTLITSTYFESLAKKAGLPFVGIGSVEDFVACLDHPDMWHPSRGFRVVAEWGVLRWMRTAYQLIAERHEPGRT